MVANLKSTEQDKKRVNVNLSSDSIAQLQRFAARHGLTMTEAIRIAIKWSDYLDRAMEADNKVLLETPDGKYKELVFSQLIVFAMSDDNLPSSSTEDEVDSIENLTSRQISGIIRDVSSGSESKIKAITGNINETDARIKISQESTRSKLAYSLFITYTITILLILLLLIFTEKIQPDNGKEIIILILTSQSTIIGSALGFYFGKEN